MFNVDSLRVQVLNLNILFKFTIMVTWLLNFYFVFVVCNFGCFLLNALHYCLWFGFDFAFDCCLGWCRWKCCLVLGFRGCFGLFRGFILGVFILFTLFCRTLLD